MARTKYVTIESPGKLNVLGGILGPVKIPCYLDLDIVIALIGAGKIVYEVNPSNTKEKTRLTRHNVLNQIYDYSITKSKQIKAQDVGVSSATITPSTVETTIVKETGEGMVGTDIFYSNKLS